MENQTEYMYRNKISLHKQMYLYTDNTSWEIIFIDYEVE